MALTCFSLILDTGVIPSNNGAFAFFVAAQNGLASALCTCLLINGFVGFQLYEDGTTLSVWLLYGFSAAMFIISGAVSLLTFKSWAGLGPENTAGMFVVLYIFNCVFLFIYVVMQFLLVLNTLQDRWPLGDIFFGCLFLTIGQIILYALNDKICEGASHYFDGLFFATICNLLAIMMVYKVCWPTSSAYLHKR
jgi:chitin synthase III-like protein